MGHPEYGGFYVARRLRHSGTRLMRPVARSRRLDGSGITRPASVIWSNLVPDVPIKTAERAVPANAVPAAFQVAEVGSEISASMTPVPSRPLQRATEPELSAAS